MSGLREKEIYWVPHPGKVWTSAMILKIKEGSALVRFIDDGTELDLNLQDYPFFSMNPRAVDDMTSLYYLHEPGILRNLDERAQLQNQRPYTYVSNVLVAVNPLRRVEDPDIGLYRANPISSCPPHPWGITENAYRLMCLPKSDVRNQSIVISGESGAGKTETAKIVLRYLCWRTAEDEIVPTNRNAAKMAKTASIAVQPQETASRQRSASSSVMSTRPADLALAAADGEHKFSGSEEKLDKRLLDSNPILEAFGNAKTLRNNNSSRFGKFMKLQFCPKQPSESKLDLTKDRDKFCLVGACIETYLLERSRVCTVASGERNYHVFYQMLKGANEKQSKAWKLHDADFYSYLNQSMCEDVEEVSDADDFGVLCSALKNIGITDSMVDVVFRLLSGILQLGNLTFRNKDTDQGPAAQIQDLLSLNLAAEMFGIEASSLESIICTRQLQMAGGNQRRQSSYRINRDAANAEFARDGISKFMYQQIFDWIVSRVGVSLNRASDELPFIGVLDIFGFESFEENSLEQLLINYANEALQETFNKAVLEAEQRLYEEEGLKVSKIEYVSNHDCVELISGNQGIISFLDATCGAPNPTDDKFLQQIQNHHRKNDFFPKPHPKDVRDSFIISHYAMPVKYKIGTFVRKNMDTVPPELQSTLQFSKHVSRCDIFEFNLDDDIDLNASAQGRSPAASTTAPSTTATVVRDTRAMTMRLPQAPIVPNSAEGPGRKRSVKLSMTAKFIRRMKELVAVLEGTTCSFIRCIKPNSTMSVGVFESRYVVEQLRSLGIVQTCEVLKVGMPTRISFSEVESMYRSKVPAQLQRLLRDQDAKGFTTAVLWAFQITSDAVQLGRTRVFFRTGKIALLDEMLQIDMNSERGEWLCQRLRTWVSRKTWRRAFAKVLAQNKLIRIYLRQKKQKYSAIKIQATWRMFLQSAKFRRKLSTRRRRKLIIRKMLCLKVALEDYLLVKQARDLISSQERQAVDAAKKEEEEKQKLEEELKKRPSLVEHTKSMQNIRAVAAASMLATVSVCIFRWQRVKYFKAYEKWLECCTDEVDGKTSSLDRLMNRRVVIESQLMESPEVAETFELCFECDERRSALWCTECLESYCTVCNSFVHNTCKKMKGHESGPLTEKPEDGELSIMRKMKRSKLQAPDASVLEDKDGSDDETAKNTKANSQNGKSLGIIFGKIKDDSAIKGGSALKGDSSDEDDDDYRTTRMSMSARKTVLLGNKQANNASKMLNPVAGGAKKKGHVKTDSLIESLKLGVNVDSSDKHGPIARRGTVTNSRIRTTTTVAPSFQRSEGGQICAIRDCGKPATKGIATRFCDLHYEEFRRQLRENAASAQAASDGAAEAAGKEEVERKTLQNQIAMLKKQLEAAGQKAVEFVELSTARQNMQKAVEKLMQGDSAAEKDVERWDQAIRLNPDYQKEEEEKANKWESDEYEKNRLACVLMRRMIPPNILGSSMHEMMELGVPKTVSQRIWTKKTLWLIRMHPDDIKRFHVADLQSKYNNQGLDIIEMRAVWFSLPVTFDNDGDGKKVQWRGLFRQKLLELTTKELQNRLSKQETRNPGYKGFENLQIFDPEIPLIRANALKSTAFSKAESAVEEILKGKENADSGPGNFKCFLFRMEDGKFTERYAVLHGHMLDFFLNDADSLNGQPCFSINVDHSYVVAEVQSALRQHCFDLSNDSNVNNFSADIARNKSDWLSHITGVIEWSKSNQGVSSGGVDVSKLKKSIAASLWSKPAPPGSKSSTTSKTAAIPSTSTVQETTTTSGRSGFLASMLNRSESSQEGGKSALLSALKKKLGNEEAPPPVETATTTVTTSTTTPPVAQAAAKANPFGGIGGGRGDLLSALKKRANTQESPAKETSSSKPVPMNDLFSAIKKRQNAEDTAVAKPPIGIGGVGDKNPLLAALQARTKKAQPDESSVVYTNKISLMSPGPPPTDMPVVNFFMPPDEPPPPDDNDALPSRGRASNNFPPSFEPVLPPPIGDDPQSPTYIMESDGLQYYVPQARKRSSATALPVNLTIITNDDHYAAARPSMEQPKIVLDSDKDKRISTGRDSLSSRNSSSSKPGFLSNIMSRGKS